MTRIVILALPVIGLLGLASAEAADHSEAPGTRADQPADIADLYVWHDGGTEKLVAVVTFAGLAPPAGGQSFTFDENVLYFVHLDRDGDFLSDVDVSVSFATDGEGARGMLVENLPGASGPVMGTVGQPIDAGGGRRVIALLADDPFFFDLEGFRATLATGTLMFDPSRDSVAGLNASAIVLEMSLSAALGAGAKLNVWTSTSREVGS